MSPFFITLVLIAMLFAAILYLGYCRLSDRLSVIWGSQQRLQRPYANNANWVKQHLTELEQARMEESIAAHAQTTALTPATAAQTWTIADGIATVYDDTSKHHSYEVYQWGIVQDHGQQVVVNLSLVHLLPHFPEDMGQQLKTRSYFRLHNPLDLTLDRGAITFGTADAVRLPETVAEMRDDRMAAMMKQCRSCKYVHWQRYGNSLLVCGVHPDGKLGCEDWKFADRQIQDCYVHSS